MLKLIAVLFFLTTFGFQVITASTTGTNSLLLDESGITTQVPDDNTDVPATSTSSGSEHGSTSLQDATGNTSLSYQSEKATVGPEDDINEMDSRAVNATTDIPIDNTEGVLANGTDGTGNVTIPDDEILLDDFFNSNATFNSTLVALNITESLFKNATTASPLPPLSQLSCDIINEFGGWSFFFLYDKADIDEVMCRCKGFCDDVTSSPDVSGDLRLYLKDPLSDVNLKGFISLVSVYIFIFIFGVFGNVLTLVGLSTWMKQKSPTYGFIMSLACSDLLLLCVCLPLKVTEFYQLGSFTIITCKGSYYLRDIIMVSSVITLTVISFERFYAICKPFIVQYLCTWSRARKIIVITWAISLVLALPTIFLTKLYTPTDELPECLPQSTNYVYLIVYFTYFTGVLFALPSIVMAYTYGQSCRVLWRSAITAQKLKGQENKADSEAGKKESKQDTDDIQSRKKVVRGLVCIYILFVICWGPSLVIQLLSGMSILKYNSDKFRLACDTLTYFSSAANPYMFMTISSQFCAPALRCLFRRTTETNQELTTSRATELTSNFGGPMPSSPAKY